MYRLHAPSAQSSEVSAIPIDGVMPLLLELRNRGIVIYGHTLTDFPIFPDQDLVIRADPNYDKLERTDRGTWDIDIGTEHIQLRTWDDSHTQYRLFTDEEDAATHRRVEAGEEQTADTMLFLHAVCAEVHKQGLAMRETKPANQRRFWVAQKVRTFFERQRPSA